MTTVAKMGSRLPDPIRNRIRDVRILKEFLLDARAYARSTNARPRSGRAAGEQNLDDWLEARLAIAYHRIEKGFALPEPRRPFGSRSVLEAQSILALLDESQADRVRANLAQDAITANIRWNETGHIDEVVAPIRAIPREQGDFSDLTSFFASRHSVRHFDLARTVAHSDIEKAVAIAQTAPSVCNRQPGRAYFTDDSSKIEDLLSLQGGNRGFGHEVPTLAIVTTRRALFKGPNERNQRWIDGAIFGTYLMLALHGLGIDSCVLNWSQYNSVTHRLRDRAPLPADEDVVFMLAIGYGAIPHRYARSERRPISDVLRFI